ncbi:nucleolar complex protein 3-like protein [Iris pallida]|uniref:Nucleolar complex protein 3-like protein n=1 Tax=Iris pallida TaxID=29817 RepID=A0AAX6E1I9_IRIPA|nr:nucleolar complex protein 3-like protein [Iris pallida]KAJ6817421.1 nucleolar complex protein 3-like protein [Iris pallida]
MQSDTLTAVCGTYFRILKRSMDLSVSRSALYTKCDLMFFYSIRAKCPLHSLAYI